MAIRDCYRARKINSSSLKALLCMSEALFQASELWYFWNGHRLIFDLDKGWNWWHCLCFKIIFSFKSETSDKIEVVAKFSWSHLVCDFWLLYGTDRLLAYASSFMKFMWNSLRCSGLSVYCHIFFWCLTLNKLSFVHVGSISLIYQDHLFYFYYRQTNNICRHVRLFFFGI